MCLIDELYADANKPRTYTKEEMFAFAETLMLELLSEQTKSSPYPEVSIENITRIKKVLNNHK